jgi:hypothetical protein
MRTGIHPALIKILNFKKNITKKKNQISEKQKEKKICSCGPEVYINHLKRH